MFLVAHVIGEIKAKVFVELARPRVDPSFLLQLSLRRFEVGLLPVAMPFGKIPAIGMTHQQKFRLWHLSEQQHSRRSDEPRFGHAFFVGWLNAESLCYHRGMKIYTRTGDTGTTGLFGGPRVRKDDVRIEAYGTVDELNAVLGCVRSALEVAYAERGHGSEAEELLKLFGDYFVSVQHELFSLGAELASPRPDDHQLRVIGAAHIERLERWIDESESRLAPLKQFILPGGSVVASQIHVARGVCRRSERRVISLAESVGLETPIGAETIVYLNRLSDWLFVVSRDINRLLGCADQPWIKPDCDEKSAIEVLLP